MKTSLAISLLIIKAAISACNGKEQATVEEKHPPISQRIEVRRSFLLSNYTKEKLEEADFIGDYLNIMYDSSVEYRNSKWDSKILTDQQDFFLKGGFEKGFLMQNSPQILGIRETNGQQYEVKLATEQNSFVYKKMNLTVTFDALNRPYFIDQLGEHLNRFDKKSLGTIEFLYSPGAAK